MMFVPEGSWTSYDRKTLSSTCVRVLERFLCIYGSCFTPSPLKQRISGTLIGCKPTTYNQDAPYVDPPYSLEGENRQLLANSKSMDKLRMRRTLMDSYNATVRSAPKVRGELYTGTTLACQRWLSCSGCSNTLLMNEVKDKLVDSRTLVVPRSLPGGAPACAQHLMSQELSYSSLNPCAICIECVANSIVWTKRESPLRK